MDLKTKNKASMKSASPLLILLLLLTLILSITCKQPFTLVEDLDGPSGIALDISPKTSQLVLLDTMTLQAVGGIPPYFFSLSEGDGSIDVASGLFTAPALTGSTVVEVKDSAGLTDTATITIISGGGPEPLSIIPTAISLPVGNSLTFTANGGETPYTFSLLSGSGTVSAAGAYLAPNMPGTDVIRVSDNIGTIQDATVTITTLTTNVDYAVTAVTDTSFTTVGGDPLDGSFYPDQFRQLRRD